MAYKIQGTKLDHDPVDLEQTSGSAYMWYEAEEAVAFAYQIAEMRPGVLFEVIDIDSDENIHGVYMAPHAEVV